MGKHSIIANDKTIQFQTPKFVCEYMVDLLSPFKVKHVLEPTPGEGNILNTLRNRKYCTHTVDDYFDLPKDKRYDAVVMNPPFNCAYADLTKASNSKELIGLKFGYFMLEEAMKRANVVVALLPVFTIIDSDIRTKQILDFGLVGITQLPRKTFGYTRIQTVILCLNKGWKKRAWYHYLNE